jgi:hypothetical protein
MWNLTYCNRVCNQYERFRDHKTHVNKLLTIKSSIDTNTPYKPLFLVNKCNRTQNEINKNIKLVYENSNLLGKIKRIQKGHSLCHPNNNIVKECPAFKKTNFIRNKTQGNISNENMVCILYK